MIENAICKFKEYTSNYDMNIKEISLKYHHSFAVMDLMGELAFRLNLDKEMIELARVIGLLHDIGRFEQINKYHEFCDQYYDHTDESVKYLFDQGHIREFLEEDKYDNIIKCAIQYHNKLEIPDNLGDLELLFSKMIRDMDKVDCYKQFAVHLENVFNAEEVTKEVLETFQKERLIDANTVKSKSDSVIMYLAFIFDINFDESYDILVETDNFDLYLGTVDVFENSEKLWRKLREICFDKINRGVSDNIE